MMTKQRYSLVFLLCGVTIFLILVASHLTCMTVEIEPSEVRKAKPYIEKIVVNDAELRQLASNLVQDYDENEGKVNAIYRYVVENFSYIADPEDTDLV